MCPKQTRRREKLQIAIQSDPDPWDDVIALLGP
jgi:hypothetical protein